jgi:hypothetical protein
MTNFLCIIMYPLFLLVFFVTELFGSSHWIIPEQNGDKVLYRTSAQSRGPGTKTSIATSELSLNLHL